MLVYMQGLMLGFAMILPIGPQNAFVMMQGIRRQYYLMASAICAISDMVLLSVGIFGGGLVLRQSPLLMQMMTWGGAAFLLWYGWGAFKSAWRVKAAENGLAAIPAYSRKQIILALLAVTWLNPHVYIDTVVILGSIGGQFNHIDRQFFAIGAITASVIWFFSLSILAARFAPWLQKPLVQAVINVIVGLVMWTVAAQLALGILS